MSRWKADQQSCTLSAPSVDGADRAQSRHITDLKLKASRGRQGKDNATPAPNRAERTQPEPRDRSISCRVRINQGRLTPSTFAIAQHTRLHNSDHGRPAPKAPRA